MGEHALEPLSLFTGADALAAREPAEALREKLTAGGARPVIFRLKR